MAALSSVLGGGLATISSVPPGWYGVEPTDSYVFDPAFLSPLWIERTLVPVLFLGALLGLLVGVGTLVYRDWETTRWLRVGGSLAVLGGATLGVGLYGPDLVTPAGTPAGPIAGLAGFVLLVWGGFLVLVGGPLLAYAYLKAGRRWLGGAMLGLVPAMLFVGALFSDPLVDFAGSIPLFVLGAMIARDLAFREPARDE